MEDQRITAGPLTGQQPYTSPLLSTTTYNMHATSQSEQPCPVPMCMHSGRPKANCKTVDRLAVRHLATAVYNHLQHANSHSFIRTNTLAHQLQHAYTLSTDTQCCLQPDSKRMTQWPLVQHVYSCNMHMQWQGTMRAVCDQVQLACSTDDQNGCCPYAAAMCLQSQQHTNAQYCP